MSEKYYDTEGREVSLSKLVRTEPYWAVSVITMLKQQLAEAQERIEDMEGEIAEASKPDLPEGWEWVSVSVPVTKEKSLTLIDGQGMDIMDTVKIKAFMVKYKELEAQLAEADKGYGKRIGSLINRIKELERQLAEADKGYGKRIGSLINRIKELGQQLAEARADMQFLKAYSRLQEAQLAEKQAALEEIVDVTDASYECKRENYHVDDLVSTIKQVHDIALKGAKG